MKKLYEAKPKSYSKSLPLFLNMRPNKISKIIEREERFFEFIIQKIEKFD